MKIFESQECIRTETVQELHDQKGPKRIAKSMQDKLCQSLLLIQYSSIYILDFYKLS